VLHLRVGEVAVAVGLLDLAGVQPVGAVPGGVGLEHPRVGDPELTGQVRRDRPGHVSRVGQERPEEANGAELHGEAEAVVLAAAHVHQVPVGRVEVEVAVELGLVRLAVVPAVPTSLFRAEEPLTGLPGQPRLGRPRRGLGLALGLGLRSGQVVRSAPGLARRYW